MTRSIVQRPSIDAWLLFAFVALCFLIGGGSRADTASLVILRPVSAALLTIALLRVRAWPAGFRMPLALMLAATLLIAVQLVPLPPAMWTALPGRGALLDVARVVGIAPGWHPLSMQPLRTWNALFSMLLPVTALVLGVNAGRQSTRRLLPIMIGICSLSALLGLLQVIGPDTSALYLYRNTGDGFANGLFANRNHHAAVIACVFPMLAVMARARELDPRHTAAVRLILAALALFFIAVILLTGSRAGFLLSGIGLAGGAWIYGLAPGPRRASGAAGWLRRKTPLLMAVGALLVLLAISVAVSRAPSIDRLIGAGMDGGRRFAVYPTILHMVPIYAPLGSGFGTFSEVFQIYEPDLILGPTYLNQAHNDWLQIVLEGGIPAGLIMLAAVIGFVRLSRAVLARDPASGTTALLGRSGMLTLFILGIASIVDYPARTPSVIVLAVIATLWMVFASIDDRSFR